MTLDERGLVDRPADELSDAELEAAAAEMAAAVLRCSKCGTDIRKAKRYRGSSFGSYEHVDDVRGHKAVLG